MGPFPPSFGNMYILLDVDYVSKWVEAIATLKNDAETVVKFFHKNILTYFGASRAIISDEGTHFCNIVFASLMAKYEVRHRKDSNYHHQSNGQAEISKRLYIWNMVFDGVSSWWSLNKDVFPNLDVSKYDLQSSQIQLWYREFEVADDEGVTQSPWQSGVHQQSSEEGEPSESHTPVVLRRSTRARK